jgi:hypothetical protein
MAVFVSLAGGQNVIVYQTATGVAFDELDASLSPTALDTQVANGAASAVDARALSGGGFQVEWLSAGRPMARDYNAAGVAVDAAHAWRGSPTLEPQGFASNADQSTTTLTNGDVVAGSETTGPTSYQIAVQQFDASGAAVGPAFSETAPPVSLYLAPVVAPLGDGGYLAEWVQQGNYSSQLLAEQFTAQGAPVGQVTVAAYGGFSEVEAFGYAVAGLADGGWVSAWTVGSTLGGSGGTNEVYEQQYDASGAPVGGAVELGTAASPDKAPVIDALSDGQFVVSWTSAAGPEHRVLDDPSGSTTSLAAMMQSASPWDSLATQPVHAVGALARAEMAASALDGSQHGLSLAGAGAFHHTTFL